MSGYIQQAAVAVWFQESDGTERVLVLEDFEGDCDLRFDAFQRTISGWREHIRGEGGRLRIEGRFRQGRIVTGPQAPGRPGSPAPALPTSLDVPALPSETLRRE